LENEKGIKTKICPKKEIKNKTNNPIKEECTDSPLSLNYIKVFQKKIKIVLP